MGWSINTNDLKCIGSFAAAEKHWNDAVPWKTDHTSFRPLAGRRKKHMVLIKLSQGGYECKLYNTALVTYLANGDIILRTHDSRSSIDFAWCVAPKGCNPISHKSEMFWRVETDGGREYYQGMPNIALRLEPTPAGNWKLLNEPRAFTDKVYVPKLGAAARKAIKPYSDWHKMTSRLGGIPYMPFVLPAKTDVEALLYKPNDVEFYPLLASTGATPERVLAHAYELMGAYAKVPTPAYSLPKELS